MVLPGNGKDLQQFTVDDAVCRQWALQQTRTTPSQVAADTTVSGAAVGTAIGAAAGAAVGAAAGSPATGAAVGAGTGLLGGTAVGADNAAGAAWSVQNRYDVAYMQCMYAKGNQIPVQSGFQQPSTTTWQAPDSGVNPPTNIPPPPAGSPPPPPPGPSR